jgi:cytochrome c biogenesis protein CcmG/thiol:disulfide interchange protein DsbE
LLNQAAPQIEGETLDGSTFSLADERGKWVVVNFFQTTCIPCIEEHPELIQFSERHEQIGDAVVVSVAFSDSRANVAEFFEENGGDWPVLASDTGRYAIGYGVAAVPETFIVNPAGVIVSKFIGGVDALGLDAEIARLAGLSS